MGKLFFLLLKKNCLLLGAVLLFLSCDKNRADIYEGYGMVDRDDMNHFSILLDDGQRIYPQDLSLDFSRLHDSTRAKAIFSIAENKGGDTYVNLLALDTLLTKPILSYDPSILDSVGNAPVKIINAWIAHGFLNFEFMYVGNTRRHMVNLLQYPSEEGKLEFRFHHNDFDDEEYRADIGVVSFRLQPIVAELPKPIEILIKYNDSGHSLKSLNLIYQ